MNNRPRILLAVGNENVSQILRKHINMSGKFHLIDQEVMHFRYLDEIIEMERPDQLIVHDVFLPSDKKGKEEREEEWLTFFHLTRQKYDTLRIVFLCERSRDDIFLNQIVGLGVLDIFNESAINMDTFTNQLSNPAKYANVAKFRDTGSIAAVTIEGKLSDDQKSLDKSKANEDVGEVNVNSTDANQSSDTLKADSKPKKVPRSEKPPKEKVIEKTVEKLVLLPVEKKTILVGSPFTRSGSTFVSHLLAKAIADLGVPVTYIENPFQRAYSYDRFDGHRRTESYRSLFYSYLEKNASFYNYRWDIDGVQMIVKHPDEPIYTEEQVDFELFIKILLKIESPISIIDVGSDWDKKVYQDLMDVASNVFMVIEPDISDIQYLEDPSNSRTSTYREVISHENTILLGNRMNEHFFKNKLIKELYSDKLQIAVPYYSLETVFECQERAIFINDHSENKEKVQVALSYIIDKIVPESILRRKRKRRLFANLF